MRAHVFPLWAILFGLLLAAGVSAATYHVSPQGNDQSPGTEERPFRTIQKAADQLKPGDTVIVGPGVYRESVKIDELIGTKEKPIVIRARIPRASFLIGSVTVGGWEKVPNARFTWSAALDRVTTRAYERDTNRQYVEQADLYRVDDTPASFMVDETARRIYVHTSDDRPPAKHLIDACVHDRGFDLWSGGPANWQISLRKHIRIEGFVLCGYAKTGIHFMRGDSCEIRDCVAHHCGAGLFMHSSIRSAIRDSAASWCYDRNDNEGGGIAFRGRVYDDVVENCIVHDIVKYGIRHYGGGFQGCIIRNCLAYRIGRCAIHTKGRPDKERRHAERFSPPASNRPMTVEHNVAVEPARPHTILFSAWGMRHNTIGSRSAYQYRSGMGTRKGTQLTFDPKAREASRFADPAYHDFRLQSDSPHRGKDVGAFPHMGDVFFVGPNGDDRSEGTSVRRAWKDVSTALARLQPGQTLYVLPGEYSVAAKVELQEGKTTCVRSRGRGRVVFEGRRNESGLRVVGQGVLEIAGILFEGYRGTALSASPDAHLKVRRCVFARNGVAVHANGRATVTKSVFHSNNVAVRNEPEDGKPVEVYGCILNSNILAYSAVKPLLSNFNCFIAGGIASLGEAAEPPDLPAWQRRTGQDGESIEGDPKFLNPDEGDYRVGRNSPCRGRGYLWSPIGIEETPYHWYETESSPVFEDVGVSLATPTMANLTWRTRGGRTTALVRYGFSADKLDRLVARTSGQHMGACHAVTLFDLEPGTTYYYQVGSAPYRMMYADHLAKPMDDSPPVWDPAVRPFTTPLAFTPKRRTLYVSKSKGNDANDGRSPDRAFAGLHKASREAEPGDTVMVGAGEYFGLLRPVNSGLPDAPIVFRAAPGERVELSGKRLTHPRSVVLFDKRHIVLKGFVFKEHCKMLQDDVGGGAQLMIGDCRDIRVEDCLFDGRMYYMASNWVFRSRDVRFSDNVYYILSNYTGLILGMNPGPIVFDHNTFYRAATSFGHITRNEEVVFTNNVFGEKTRNKWSVPKFNVFRNRLAIFDYNYYVFDEENEHRYCLRILPPEADESQYSKGVRPLETARSQGLEVHGKTGPEPWLKAAKIAEKSKRIRGVEPRLQNYGSLEMEDFVLAQDATCRGMASDGGDPGRRETSHRVPNGAKTSDGEP